jgi:hypothetical protein
MRKTTNKASHVSPSNKILNGNYIIGIDAISHKSKGAMCVIKQTEEGIEIVSLTQYSRYPWLNKIKFKWMVWMLYLKHFRKVRCVREIG